VDVHGSEKAGGDIITVPSSSSDVTRWRNAWIRLVLSGASVSAGKLPVSTRLYLATPKEFFLKSSAVNLYSLIEAVPMRSAQGYRATTVRLQQSALALLT
jgi:hypothetical protein